MPLLNRAFNFFIFDASYNPPAVTILLSLRNCKAKVKLLRSFAVKYIKSASDKAFSLG